MKTSKAIQSRRRFLRTAGAGTVLVAMSGLVASRTSRAGGHLPKLDPSDPQATALGYVHETTTAGQQCNNCQLWQGGDKDWGGCAIFPGKEVAAKGWCKSWVMKSG